MITPRTSKLPAPRAADWGFGVTIGIGAICEYGSEIVTITDRKVDFGGYGADRAVDKSSGFVCHRREKYSMESIWFALAAGNDVEYVDPVLGRARELLNYSSVHPASEIANALDAAFGESLRKQIENKVLRKRGFTSESFAETGRQRCTPSVYMSLCDRIDRVKLSLKFLLCGYDRHQDAHLFEIDGENAPKCYDSLGMWAIGEGAYPAMSCLSYYVDKLGEFAIKSESEALFLALGAKFMAESAGTVGKETRAEIITFNNIRLVDEKTITSVREIWEKEAALRLPDNIKDRMQELKKRDKW